MAFPPPSLLPSITALSTHLHEHKQTISFAETATGGLLSATLLSLPSASRIYRGGLCLYTLPSRVSYAGWTQADIDAYRGPTPDVVARLASNVRATLGADWVLAESGTAGPTGGNTRNRTPGYVALAVAGSGGTTWTREVETGSKERVENMLLFAEEAGRFVLDVVEGRLQPDAASSGAEGAVGSVGQQEGGGRL